MNRIRFVALLILATVAGSASAEYSLQTAEAHPTGSLADAVAVADVTGDGRDDVVLTTTTYSDPTNDCKVFIYRQKTDGTLSAPTRVSYLAAETSVSSVALADMDDDGRKDIVVGHDQGITILRWIGGSSSRLSATLVPTALDQAAAEIVVLDVNRDGNLDVVGLSGSDGATVYLGDGRGHVTRQIAVTVPANGFNDMETGDFDNDGFVDVAVVSGANFLPVYILHNDGSDDFAAPVPLDASPGFNGMSGVLGAGDFNGDGRIDLAAMRDESSFSLFLQDGAGGFLAPGTLATVQWPDAALGHDLNLDGLDDLVVLSGGYISLRLQGNAGLGDEVSVFHQGGNGLNSQGLAVGDVNGDSCPDVVDADYALGLVVSRGSGCNPVADLRVGLELTRSLASVHLEDIGAADAAAPEIDIAISVSRGTLATGTLPAQCVSMEQTQRRSTIRCTLPTLGAGQGTIVQLPLTRSGGDSRTVLNVTAAATTTTTEVSLADNVASRSSRSL